MFPPPDYGGAPITSVWQQNEVFRFAKREATWNVSSLFSGDEFLHLETSGMMYFGVRDDDTKLVFFTAPEELERA
jgi:hypothetical protein